MFLIQKAIVILFVQTTLSYGWPANYSKSSATYGIGALDDEVDWSQHPCRRECKDHEKPMTCRYGFTIENYATMARACYDCPSNVTDCYRPHCIPADGNARMVFVANRQLPGPRIEVCKGDQVIVDVNNQLYGESTTIHWHGLHQRGTPFMDGVPMITQCPIPAGSSFRYEFKAEQPGTHWWHSHSGFQRMDGVFGSLIVRKPASMNLVGHLYDRDEHVIMLNEWHQYIGAEAYTLLYQIQEKNRPHSILVNGLGPYGNNSETASIPRAVFLVKKGSRNRFRVVGSAGFECSFIISVDNHPLLVISADGADVEPIEVDAVRLTSGERYDFVLNANRDIDNYKISVTGDGNCHRASGQAILKYEGAADNEPKDFKTGKRVLNPVNEGAETEGALCVSCVLRSIEPDDNDVSLPQNADYQFFLNLDYYALDSRDYYRKNLYDTHQVPVTSFMLQINHLSYVSPKFPLQTQPDLIRPNHLCNVTEAKCTRELCSCPHVFQLKLNSTVELVMVNEESMMRDVTVSHPMHLHGFYYRVIAMEKLDQATTVEKVKAWDQAGKIHRKLKGAPWKDVIDVPSGGYTIIRFRADNPGYWFFHCHLESHMHNGMAMVVKVGEHKDFPPVPINFPKCH